MAQVLSSLSGSRPRLSFDLDSYRDKLYLTHNFHPYPAKFVPQIPRVVIERLSSPGDVVLDPFCGSGTTLVESNLLGRNAIGIDINPIAVLASRVKTRKLNGTQLAAVKRIQRRIELVAAAVRKGRALPKADIPQFLNRDHWFQSNIQRELAVIRDNAAGVGNSAAREFCFLAMSAIIVKVSNQDSETRWAAVPKNLPDCMALDAFVSKLDDMIPRIEEFSASASGSTTVIEQSVESDWPVKPGSVDLLVTSPPYMNSFDYYLYHKLRCFWLGFDHYKVQAGEIGSRNKHCDQSEGVDAYTDSMSRFFRQAARALKRGRFATIIVGDSIYRGKVIDMLPVFRRAGEAAGFKFAEAWSYDQRKYTTAFTPRLKTAFKRTHIISFGRS